MIKLQKIDSKNIWEIVGLTVDDGQENFVATNTESLLEAYAATAEGSIALPFAIYNDDIPVGFVMFGYGDSGDGEEPEIAKDSYCLWRFMIDKHCQRKGYGRAALEAAVAYVKTRPCGPADFCWLSYEPENSVAKALYASVGFRENGKMCGEEAVAVLAL